MRTLKHHAKLLGAAAKARRQELKLDIYVVAAISGISFQCIRRIEMGQGNPTLKTLLKLCDVYDFTFDISRLGEKIFDPAQTTESSVTPNDENSGGSDV